MIKVYRFFLFALLMTVLSGSVLQAKNEKKFADRAYKKAEAGLPLTEAEIKVVADSVHRRYPTLDTHNDTATYWNHPDGDYGVKKGQVSFEKMRQGGLDGAFFAVYLDPGPIDKHSLDSVKAHADNEFELCHRYMAAHSDEAAYAYRAGDVDSLKRIGKRIVVQAIENGYPIGWDINNVKHYYDLGVRAITLSHNGHNTICDAAMDKKPPMYGGLSPFGIEVIKEMNRLGIMIDLSHGASSTLADVLKYSAAPIIASHSGARAIKDHKRNLTDDELRAIAANGGTIQVATGRYFLSTLPKNEVGVSILCDHIMHVIEVAGEDHVGIGTDFDGGGGVVGLEDVSKMKEITYELLRRGLTPAQLGKFWGGNILRVWRDVEKGSFILSQNEKK